MISKPMPNVYHIADIYNIRRELSIRARTRRRGMVQSNWLSTNPLELGRKSAYSTWALILIKFSAFLIPYGLIQLNKLWRFRQRIDLRTSYLSIIHIRYAIQKAEEKQNKHQAINILIIFIINIEYICVTKKIIGSWLPSIVCEWNGAYQKCKFECQSYKMVKWKKKTHEVKQSPWLPCGHGGSVNSNHHHCRVCSTRPCSVVLIRVFTFIYKLDLLPFSSSRCLCLYLKYWIRQSIGF